MASPQLDAKDVDDGWEQDLLFAWWVEAARVDLAVAGPNEPVMHRTPGSAQWALDALSGSRLFAGTAERVLIGNLKQVSAYFADSKLRAEVARRVATAVTVDARVIIGRSLGSVVAYEGLCARPEWPVRTLVRLGSPLGVRHLSSCACGRRPPDIARTGNC
jgi:hypothetical protein